METFGANPQKRLDVETFPNVSTCRPTPKRFHVGPLRNVSTSRLGDTWKRFPDADPWKRFLTWKRFLRKVDTWKRFLAFLAARRGNVCSFHETFPRQETFPRRGRWPQKAGNVSTSRQKQTRGNVFTPARRGNVGEKARRGNVAGFRARRGNVSAPEARQSGAALAPQPTPPLVLRGKGSTWKRFRKPETFPRRAFQEKKETASSTLS